jgi:hypothetical protein
VRQLFYVMVSRHLIEKDERQYKNVTIRLALRLRQSGIVPWSWLVDETRWVRRPQTYGSIRDALRETARAYRRSLWRDAAACVEVWCESLSIAGVIADETDQWDVPLFPGKGYASHDFLHSAAVDIAERGRPTIIYLLGDYDPSGQDIIRHVRDNLRRYAPGADIRFEVAAATPEQIERWNLPGHPPKAKDSRRKRYVIDQAVELEAIPPKVLCELVKDLITRHVDIDVYNRLMAVEEAERQTLLSIAERGVR